MIKSFAELKQRIRIREKTNGITEKGHPTTSWQDFGAKTPGEQVFRYAKWQWLHGNEFFQAAAVNAGVVAEVSINYVKGLKPDMRVIYKDVEYEILPPLDNILEKNRFIVFKVRSIEGG
jgi:SPP1 family predicted phage head-tail adaptor